MSQNTKSLIEEHDVQWVDLRFTDSHGKEQHVTVSSRLVDENFFKKGKMFDGSSIAGWRSIHESDMVLLPDDHTAVLDPFTEETTLNLRCNVLEPQMAPYERDPRSIAEKAEAYLKKSGIADHAYFGPEPEFFIFDDVHWKVDMSGSSYSIHSEEAAWSSDKDFADGNKGHRTAVKGGYFPVPPVDSMHDIRTAISQAMEAMGLDVDVHHHEVGTAGQVEIGVHFNSLTRKADEIQIYKYCAHNVAHAYGKTATFMPKPIFGDNGNGMHVHLSLFKGDQNIFSGDKYAGLSDTALYYIGGIIKHAKALNAFTNPSTNSYKRLVPGFEAPVILAYSSCNRSASIRIPFESTASSRRIEVRFPDPSANPYLAFATLLMAGLDGIKNKIHPGDAADHDLYALSPAQAKKMPVVSNSLEEALDALHKDHDFLLVGEVFSANAIAAYIELKSQEYKRLHATTHPVEFEMYYSC